MLGTMSNYTLFGGRKNDSASSKRSRSSLNAKYDRMLGNTHSLRTGRGSLETIKQVEEEKRKLDEERQRKRDEEQQALFKKLGIVASPGFASKAKRTTEQVVADLQKYRLGNVKPVKPVNLGEELKNILNRKPAGPKGIDSLPMYPPAPSHDTQQMAPPPLQQPPNPYAVHPGLFPPHAHLQPQVADHPLMPPIPFPTQPPGYWLPAQGGWIFYPHFDQSLPQPSNDPWGHTIPTLHAPHVNGLYDAENGMSTIESARQPQTLEQNQAPAYQQPYVPKGILKPSSDTAGHSDPPSSSRQVRFRDTPDFEPSQSGSQAFKHGSLPSDERLEVERVLEGVQHAENGRRRRPSAGIPQSLKQAHSLLLIPDGGPTHTGKPSARVLVRELERIAEEFPYRPRYFENSPYEQEDDMDGGLNSQIEVEQSHNTRQSTHDLSDDEESDTETPPRDMRPPQNGFTAVKEGRRSHDTSPDDRHRRIKELDVRSNGWTHRHRQDRQLERDQSGVLLPHNTGFDSFDVDKGYEGHPDQYDGNDTSSASEAESDEAGHHEDASPSFMEHNSRERSPEREMNGYASPVKRPRYDTRPSQNPLRQDSFYPSGSFSSLSLNPPASDLSARSDQTPSPDVLDSTYDLRNDNDESYQPHYAGVQAEGGSHNTPHDLPRDHHEPLPDHASRPAEYGEEEEEMASVESSLSGQDVDHFEAYRPSSPRSDPITAPIPTPVPARKRHRFGDLDDPTDGSYHPSSTPEPDELEYYEDGKLSPSPSPEPEFGPKRIRLNEGIWTRFEVPSDKLPPPPPIKPKRRAKLQPKQRDRVKSEPFTQSQSQVSEIETQFTQDEQEHEYDDAEEEDIEEDGQGSWKPDFSDNHHSHPHRFGLPTIGEEDEEEQGITTELPDFEPLERGAWAEEGFFGDGEPVGFRVWQDGY